MIHSAGHILTPEDLLARQRQKVMEDAQTITLNNGSKYQVGDWRALSPDQQYAGFGITPPWLAAGPAIQPPGKTMNTVTPPASFAPANLTPQQLLPELDPNNPQNQIPMPGQLGNAAKQSPLFSENWASMFNQG